MAYSTPLREEDVRFNITSKKNPKFTAVRTMIITKGTIIIVSISACPELLRTNLGMLIATTLNNPRGGTDPPGLRLHFLLWFSYFFICRQALCILEGFGVRHLQLVQQAMQVAAADAQFLGRLRLVAAVHPQGRAH